MKRPWLDPFTWAVIVETNRQLCQPKGALHKPTTDGYEPARQLWESLRRMPVRRTAAALLFPIGAKRLQVVEKGCIRDSIPGMNRP